MVKISIDGKELEATSGDMIIEVADREGIYIPRFCYHKKLSIAANCRMCMVEVTHGKNVVPACATPVVDGLEIKTKSSKALAAQRAVLEFLLINHPLDCPICDQGGECELQDLSMGYGDDSSRFSEEKRVVDDPDIGSLITTNMTRCIHCTRCIRFGKEVAGVQELGLVHRGVDTEVRTYVGEAVKSNLSGNLIDICPVGALNSKPYAYQARAWELSAVASIATHDCLGANTYLHVRENQLFRVVARENSDFNETWISDRDRFSYLAVQHEDRVEKPLVKENGRWVARDWNYALELVSRKLGENIKKYGSDNLAGIISPSATTEELYLFQKFIRGLGSNNVDHRIRQQDFSDDSVQPICSTSLTNFAELEASDTILIIGSDIQEEQPLMSTRLRAAIKNGAQILHINPMDYDFNLQIAAKIIIGIDEMPYVLSMLVDRICNTSISNAIDINKDVIPNIDEIVEIISNTKKLSIITGAHIEQHEYSALFRYMLKLFIDATKTHWFRMTHGANSVGAWLSGAVPHRQTAGEVVENPGMSAVQALQNNLQTYILHNLEPELDCLNGNHALQSLNNADFVVSLNPFVSDKMREYCDVILPIGTFAEISGSYFNMFGKKQTVTSGILPLYESRPGWKVLRAMGSFMKICGFEFDTINDVLVEFKDKLKKANFNCDREYQVPDNFPKTSKNILVWPCFYTDGLSRRSYALKQASQDVGAYVFMNQHTASELGCSEGRTLRINPEISAEHTIKIDNRLKNGSYLIQQGLASNVNIDIKKIADDNI